MRLPFVCPVPIHLRRKAQRPLSPSACCEERFESTRRTPIFGRFPEGRVGKQPPAFKSPAANTRERNGYYRPTRRSASLPPHRAVVRTSQALIGPLLICRRKALPTPPKPLAFLPPARNLRENRQAPQSIALRRRRICPTPSTQLRTRPFPRALSSKYHACEAHPPEPFETTALPARALECVRYEEFRDPRDCQRPPQLGARRSPTPEFASIAHEQIPLRHQPQLSAVFL
jgi:hypothetical protein